MILRPDTEPALVAALCTVLADEKLELDVRAMLAMLLADRCLVFCPTKSMLRQILAVPKNQAPVIVGRGRLDRMVREAEAAGYMARATWRVPRERRALAYSFIMGLPADVAAFAARKVAGGGQ